MKNQFSFWKLAAFAGCALLAVACSDDDTPEVDLYDTVDFENAPSSVLCGPTSYGDNCYEVSYNGTNPPTFISWSEPATGLTLAIQLGMNWTDFEETHEMYNGASFLSCWNYRSDIAGKNAGWWMTYQNQCSVYNVDSTDGANSGAGHSGSNFVVIYQGSAGTPGDITFPAGKERRVKDMWICNTSYAYGNMAVGDAYTKSLKEQKGWFKVIASGYAAGATEPVAQDECYLADYRTGAGFCLDRWTQFSLTNISLQPVQRIVFRFEGSDVGEWGLNTPAYVCVDDIRLIKEL